uniref:Uncharacterized protein n=1 Tax=Uncultured archaeon GZfos26G2 TaxID=3386331 RepID=Q64CX9_UNCAG|nr:hypothetical protein GZ19C8_9 [uncultured archaeon GZfos19C8]
MYAHISPHHKRPIQPTPPLSLVYATQLASSRRVQTHTGLLYSSPTAFSIASRLSCVSAIIPSFIHSSPLSTINK